MKSMFLVLSADFEKHVHGITKEKNKWGDGVWEKKRGEFNKKFPVGEKKEFFATRQMFDLVENREVRRTGEVFYDEGNGRFSNRRSVVLLALEKIGDAGDGNKILVSESPIVAGKTGHFVRPSTTWPLIIR